MTCAERLAVAEAVTQFNRGLYYECHETLEGVWAHLKGPARDFLQGLIQVSVGYHHLARGNRVGAMRTFSRALGRFEAYPARYLGFDLASERSRIQALRSAMAAGEVPAPQQPIWRFDDVGV